MNENITVRGYVATEVRLTLAPSGLPIAGFRMCSTERRFDRAAGTWVDGHTNWYSVSMFRQLATNGALSLKKGDRVVIFGRLKVRPWAKDDGRSGTSVEIDAETAGHDLMWGTAAFRRSSTDKAERSEHAGTAEGPVHPGEDAGAGSGAASGPENADGRDVGPGLGDTPVPDVPDGVDPVTGQILEPVHTAPSAGGEDDPPPREGPGARRTGRGTADGRPGGAPF